MTASTIEISAEDRRIAGYATLAITLSLAEAAIPSPLPGIKPGLANIIILVVLLRYGWHDAVWVSLLRVVGGGLLFGQFLTPGFFLSLSGAVCSLAALALSARLPGRWFSPVSHSVVAAFAHIAGQVLLARLWLLPHDGIYYLLPAFALAALGFGCINGLAAAWLLHRDAHLAQPLLANANAVPPAPTFVQDTAR